MSKKIEHIDWFSDNFQAKMLAYLQEINQKILVEQKKMIAQIKKSWADIGGGISGDNIRKQIQLSESIEKVKTEQAKLTQIMEQRLKLERQLASEVAKHDKENIKLANSLKQAKEQTKQMQVEQQKLSGTYKAHTGLIGKLTKAVFSYVGAWLSIQTVIELVKTLFTTTKELESIGFSLKSVITDSMELESTQRFLLDIAQKYGGELVALSRNYVRFRASVSDTNITLSQTKDIYETVVKAGAVLGLGSQRIELALLALEQMASKGSISMEELRRQLGDQIPRAVNIMAKALGVTIPELYRMIKANEVLAEDALPKFSQALKEAYGLEAIENVDTLSANVDKLKTSWQLLVQSLGASGTFKGAIQFLRSEVNGLRYLIDGYAEYWSSVGDFSGEALRKMEIQKSVSKDLIAENPFEYWAFFLDAENKELGTMQDNLDELIALSVELKAAKVPNIVMKALLDEIVAQRRLINTKQEYILLIEEEIDVEDKKNKVADEEGYLETLQREVKELRDKIEAEKMSAQYWSKVRGWQSDIAEKQKIIDEILGKQNKKVKDQWVLYDEVLKRVSIISVLLKKNPENVDELSKEFEYLNKILKDIENRNIDKFLGLDELTDPETSGLSPDDMRSYWEKLFNSKVAAYKKSMGDQVATSAADIDRQKQAEIDYQQFITDLRRDFGLEQVNDYEYQVKLLKELRKRDEVSEAEYLQARVALWAEANREMLQALEEAVQSIASIFEELNAGQIDLAEAEVDLHESRLSDIKSQIDQEYELRVAGQNSRYDLLVSEQQREEALRKAALERLKKLQKQEAAIQLAQQTGSLITASAKIFESMASGGIVGVLGAIGIIASMIGAFMAYKNQIQAIEAEEPEYAKGVVDFKGKGTEKSDSNRVKISNHESVITAEGTKKAPKALSMINEGALSDSDIFNVYRLNMPSILGDDIHDDYYNKRLLEVAYGHKEATEKLHRFMKYEQSQVMHVSEDELLIKQGSKLIRATIINHQ